jgi:DNA-binding NtrC family response regulator
MEKGLFREDLFYRLSNISVSLPPLRERKTDIPYLIHYYLLYYSGQNHHPPKEISKETMEYLMEYPWPGNIRELKHVVEKALLLSHQHKILPEDIGFEKKPPTEIYKLKSLAEVEKEHIIKVLNLVRGNKRKAAEILKINESTLWRKMKRYKLKDKNTEKRNYVLPSASSSERKGT